MTPSAAPVSWAPESTSGRQPLENRSSGTSRQALARQRAALARAALRDCRLCAHDCGVNRLEGEKGICRAGSQARVFTAQIEIGDEAELVPTFALAFSGCDLRCEFCITRRESWNPLAGRPLLAQELADRARAALAGRARTIMFLGGEPAVHLPDALELVAVLPEDATLVWKTNAHASNQALRLLDGLFDVWLPDLKFGNDRCARQLAGIQDYCRVTRQNLLWARTQQDLIVRHLLMPGHLECCWKPVAEWLAAEMPCVKVSLREGFWPRADARAPELRRVNSPGERKRARALAHELGLNLVP